MRFKVGRSPVAAFVAVALLMVAPAAASAADIVVNDDAAGPGPAGADCSNPDFATLQGALAAAAPGDRVLVCAGEYPGNANAGQKADLEILGPQAGIDARTRPDDESQEAVVTGNLNANNTTGLLLDGLKFRRDPADPNPTGSRIQMSANNTGDYRVINNIITSSNVGLNIANNGAIGAGVVRNNAIFGVSSSAITATAPNVQRLRIEDNDLAGTPSVIMNPQVVNNPLGGLDIEITGNRMTGSGNAAIVYKSSDVTIAGNEAVGSGSAFILGGAVDGAVVSNNTIANVPTGVSIANSFGFGPNSDISIVGNDITGTNTAVSAGLGALTDTASVHANRIVGNSTGVGGSAAAQIDATENWWGCNGGPGQAGCDSASALATTSPWLVLTLGGPTTIQSEDTQTYEASVATNSDGDPAALPSELPSAEVQFGASAGSIDSPQDLIASVATTDFTAPAANGPVELTATLDSQTVTHEVVVEGAETDPTRLIARPMVLDDEEPIVRLVFPPGHLQAQLVDETTGEPIEGRQIHFYTNSGRPLCSGVTNEIGVAACRADLGLTLNALLQLKYQAEFDGDAGYSPAHSYGSLARVLRLLEIPTSP